MDFSDWSETGSFKPNLAAQSLNLNEEEGRGVSLGWGCSQASSPSQGEAKWLQQDFFSLWRGCGAYVSFHTSPLAQQLWCLLPGSWRGGSQPQRLGWRDTICKSHAGKANGQITAIFSEEILHPLWRTLNQLPQRQYVSGAFRKANNEQAPEQLPLAPSCSRPQPAWCCRRAGGRQLLTGPVGVQAGYGAEQLALNPPHSDWEESSVSSSKWEASTQYLHSSPAPPPAKCIPGTGAAQLGQETSLVPPAKALLASCFPPPALKYWILVGANAEVDPERETFRSFSAASVLLSGQIPELLPHLWSSQFLLLWVGMLRADPTATSFSSDMSVRAGKTIFYYCVVREIPWELASSKALTPSGNVLAKCVGGWSYSPSAYDGLSISMGFGKLYPDIWY